VAQALQLAVGEGFELLHLIADGVVSSAFEGLLSVGSARSAGDPRGGDSSGPAVRRQSAFSGQSEAGASGRALVSPGELSQALRGSRVTVIGLTPPHGREGQAIQLAGYRVPSVYRAFALLGASRLELPTVLAPFGPTEARQEGDFWRGFYRSLGETHCVEEAMGHGLASQPAPPIALFLRHNLGRLFRRVKDAPRSDVVEPSQLSADLKTSHELVDRLRSMEKEYGTLPKSVSEFVARESVRQEQLSADLQPWLETAEGER
jgi:hypothetical protein